jgi:hypothetical protein
MFITGLGIGPTLSVFTIVVQNAVPFRQLGVATSNLTFFRQIGGSIGLAITGTIFATSLSDQLPRQLSAQGVPQPLIDQFANSGSSALNDLVGVGQDLGAAILAAIPPQFQEAVTPFIAQIVDAIYEAFTQAVVATFWIGVFTTVAALLIATAIEEIPLRTHHGDAPARPAEDARSLTGASATD